MLIEESPKFDLKKLKNLVVVGLIVAVVAVPLGVTKYNQIQHDKRTHAQEIAPLPSHSSEDLVTKGLYPTMAPVLIAEVKSNDSSVTLGQLTRQNGFPDKDPTKNQSNQKGVTPQSYPYALEALDGKGIVQISYPFGSPARNTGIADDFNGDISETATDVANPSQSVHIILPDNISYATIQIRDTKTNAILATQPLTQDSVKVIDNGTQPGHAQILGGQEALGLTDAQQPNITGSFKILFLGIGYDGTQESEFDDTVMRVRNYMMNLTPWRERNGINQVSYQNVFQPSSQGVFGCNGDNLTACNMIEKSGAKFLPPQTHIGKIDLRQMKDALVMAESSLSISEKVIDEGMKQVEKERPDVILHDSMSLWGKIIANKLKIPTAAIFTTMAIHPAILFFDLRLLAPELTNILKQLPRTAGIIRKHRELYRKHGLRPPFFLDIFANEEKTNLVFTSKYFQPFSSVLGPNYHYVGPIIYTRNELPIPKPIMQTKKPIIYVSLGSIHNDDLTFYKTCIAALKDSPYQVIMSIGKRIKLSKLGKVPADFFIKDYLPQLEILRRASVFVTHGGMNSINESLYFGVPMLFFPIIQEQKLNATRVEQLGAGIYPRKPVDEALLRNLIDRLMTDPKYKNSARTIGRTMIEAGGYLKGVSVLNDTFLT